MRSKAQFSGVKRASRPTFVNVCMMYSSLYLRDAPSAKSSMPVITSSFLTSDSFPVCCNSVPQSTHLREALAQFGNEQIGLLKRGEVTTFRNLVPIEQLRIGLLAPHLRRCEKIAFEDAHCNRKIEGHSREILSETLVIEPRRGCRAVGQPVESDVIQHLIERDGLRRITFVVAPCLKLLVDPHCLPNR